MDVDPRRTHVRVKMTVEEMREMPSCSDSCSAYICP